MVYKLPWVVGQPKAQRATAGALKNSLPMAWPLNLPSVTPDVGLTGIAWPVTLSARRCRAAGPPFFSVIDITGQIIRLSVPIATIAISSALAFPDCLVGVALLRVYAGC